MSDLLAELTEARSQRDYWQNRVDELVACIEEEEGIDAVPEEAAAPRRHSRCLFPSWRDRENREAAGQPWEWE